ncbi:conserved hypothetical protein [Cellulomonas flavigena DSM 20109]|uniref:Integral membrane protein n=1 Tax=Cellulomonas flavigena (strain ATCC 482 / DSM 20109 / BCRC 11376 / JCM 18109 / NBRC 3775 / NCIMB 8073 / NRS 134) TaxID=446466 RepID=D5UCB3_CELFN|nr:Pr6Pr family membrane protein [Cellulomonas flavigena]ADG74227.1 conserved hypothetical protein [Cellulomonas flavigena DSM 20109]
MTTRPGAAPTATRPPRDTAARVLHAGVAACATLGVAVEVSRALVTGDGERLVRLFSYFTIWTNVLVAGVSVQLAARPRHDGPVFRALRLDTVLCVVVTAVTVHLVLAPYVPSDPAGRVADVLTHVVTPSATVLVWALVGPRPRITWRTCATALVLPGAWLAWTFAHGAVSGWYPYPFLDARRTGLADALLGAATVVALGTLLGVLLRLVERVLPAAPR